MRDNHLHIGTAGSVNPNATNTNDTYNIYNTALPTRMDAYFQALLGEIENGITAEVFEALDYYQTKLDGTKDVEEKLTDGGFRPSRIAEAKRLKEMYAKIAMQYDCYPSAQKIIHSLFARIKHSNGAHTRKNRNPYTRYARGQWRSRFGVGF